MRVFLCILASLAISGQLSAQPSDALDPDYVVLQPYETFKGVQANQRAGGVINNVGIMVPGEKYGCVFLNSIDTVGYNDVWLEHRQPLGLFQSGADFSLFNRAKFTLENCNTLHKVFSRGANSLPLLIADRLGTFRVLYPIAPYEYRVDDSIPNLAYANRGYPFGVNWGLGTAFLNTDTLEDLLAVTSSGDSSTIAIWQGEDLEYKGDTVMLGGGTDLYRIIRHRYTLQVNGSATKNPKVTIGDLNRDNIPDILFLCDSLDEFDRHHEPRKINVAFGKHSDSNKWEVEKSLLLSPPFKVLSFMMMDFLRSDGISDLIIQSPDAIYCFDGSGADFLQSEPDWEQPSLAIPSPAILDPKNFLNNGRGLFGWYYLFDAGNVNGSGEHSLATTADYIPDTASLGGTTYLFIYSGGKAADEKVDALVALNESIYNSYSNFDTVSTSIEGLTDFLVGDPSNTAGGTGRLDFVHGSSSIPHKPNPMWKVENDGKVIQEFTMQTPSSTKNGVQVTIKSSGVSEGILTLHDILGREIRRHNIHYQGEVIRKTVLDTKSVPNGTYILLYKEQGKTLTQKIFVVK